MANMATTGSQEIKLFGKWSYDDVEVLLKAHDVDSVNLSEVFSSNLVVVSQVYDISLEDYIAVKSKNAVFVPHTAGRYQKKRFRKAQCPIVERCVQAKDHSSLEKQNSIS